MRRISEIEIQRVVAEHFNVPLDVTRQPTDNKRRAQIRHIAMFYTKLLTGAHLGVIADYFSCRNARSAEEAINSVDRLRERDPRFHATMAAIARKFPDDLDVPW